MVNDEVAPLRLTAPLEEELHRRATLRSNRAWLKSIADHRATQEHGDD
jgi:hypothetical protein